MAKFHISMDDWMYLKINELMPPDLKHNRSEFFRSIVHKWIVEQETQRRVENGNVGFGFLPHAAAVMGLCF